jgi:hypothetical protein
MIALPPLATTTDSALTASIPSLASALSDGQAMFAKPTSTTAPPLSAITTESASTTSDSTHATALLDSKVNHAKSTLMIAQTNHA